MDQEALIPPQNSQHFPVGGHNRDSDENEGQQDKSANNVHTSDVRGEYTQSGRLFDSLSSSYRQRPEGSDDDDELELTCDEATLLQAVVFIEDAIYYRSCHHKLDPKILKLYRLYYSLPGQLFLYFVLFAIHILAFFEQPSSITENWTSDIRYRGKRWVPPCGLMESIDLFCLLVLTLDVVAKCYFVGLPRTRKSKWLIAYILIILVSLVDWCVSIGYGCAETVRMRRMLRPFFILQNSSLMKKTFNCLRRTIPQVVSVLLLLGLHLYVFTLFGMLLFPKPKAQSNVSNQTDQSYIYGGSVDFQNVTEPTPDKEELYFRTLFDSLMNLLVLLTTANNPDITMPAYKKNRFYAVYFVLFLLIGLYCFMNMLTAVIYNQFRGYFQDSIQSSIFRRRVGMRAAFEVLRRRSVQFQHMASSRSFNAGSDTFGRSPLGNSPGSSLTVVSEGVPAKIVQRVVERTNLKKSCKQAVLNELLPKMGSNLDSEHFQEVFSILEKTRTMRPKPQMMWTRRPCLNVIQTIASHKFFTLFGCLVAISNVICISFELATKYDDTLANRHSILGLINLIFIIYYVIEQSLKLWALGWRLYMWSLANVFDGIITIILLIVEVLYIVWYGVPSLMYKDQSTTFNEVDISLWELVRIINILIIVRLFRIIYAIKTMSLVASTVWDLIRNLKPFAGIMVVLFYSYAIFGMELFQNQIQFIANGTTNVSYECGTFQQLDYWANNFDDFAAAIMVLWDVLVVNNWMVFLKAYSEATSNWAQLYFVVWWLLSVVIGLNLFTALILENFIMRWDRSQQARRDRSMSLGETSSSLSVHDMFREQLREPAENELLVELRNHEHLQLER